MSDLDKWWNARQESKPLTEDDLRAALEACRNAIWKPEPHYIWTKEGRLAFVDIPYPQEEESR